MALIELHTKQTPFDFLVQHAGGISGLFDFLKENNLASLEVPPAQYRVPTILNSNVADFFKSDIDSINTKPAQEVYESSVLFSDELGNEIVTENNDNIIF